MLNSPVSKRLRSLLQPRNATMVLHLLHPDLACDITSGGGSVPYRAEIQFGGRLFVGFGVNKPQARASVSELVLRSLVQPTSEATCAGDEEGGSSTPWLSLVGFAIHKLLCDWSRGEVGHTPAMVTPMDRMTRQLAELHQARTTITSQDPGAVSQTPGGDSTPGNGIVADDEVPMNDQTDASHVQTPPSKKQKVSGRQMTVNKTVVTVPDNACDIHPVTLLTRMCPQAMFTVDLAESQVCTDRYVSQVCVAGCSFSCTARTKKQAKADVARIALQHLFDVQYPNDNGSGDA